MPTSPPLIYLVLGASGSGRRELLADLIEGGLTPPERAAVLMAEGEAADAADARLPRAGSWRMEEGAIAADWPPETTHVFLVADGRRNPVDQVEAFASWLRERGLEVARVLCVINCGLAERHLALAAWYEACLHFSDVALLNRREGVANKWLSDFRERYEKAFRPCLFETVKGGRVGNPALILEPQARRVSHLFDEDWAAPLEAAAEEPEEEEGEGGDEPEADPYLERQNGGRRVRQIPDISKFLGP